MKRPLWSKKLGSHWICSGCNEHVEPKGVQLGPYLTKLCPKCFERLKTELKRGSVG